MAYAERSEPIWRSGMVADYAAIVGIGFVKMTKTSRAGQDTVMELLGPGQCLGLMAVIEGRSFPLSAIAATHCWYLKIPSRQLVPVYEANERLKDQIVRSIGPRLRKAHDMMARLSFGKVEQRIAAILFFLADSYGSRTDENLELQVPLTRQDIAEMAGTTTESTIRVLSKWQKEGILSSSHQHLTIHDEARLEVLLSR